MLGCGKEVASIGMHKFCASIGYCQHSSCTREHQVNSWFQLIGDSFKFELLILAILLPSAWSIQTYSQNNQPIIQPVWQHYREMSKYIHKDIRAQESCHNCDCSNDNSRHDKFSHHALRKTSRVPAFPSCVLVTLHRLMRRLGSRQHTAGDRQFQ